MSQVTVGDTVRIHYTGTLKNGSEFDSSAGREPLEFKVGENKIIPDLETSIVGMAVGETATVEIAAANAYGPRRDDAIQTVERTLMPEGAELEIGGLLRVSDLPPPSGAQILEDADALVAAVREVRAAAEAEAPVAEAGPEEPEVIGQAKEEAPEEKTKE